LREDRVFDGQEVDVSDHKVSVCVPTFNKARYLRSSIESVLAQTFEDYELLVLDDASTDETAEVLASFKDPRLQVVRHARNIGLQRNFNECLGRARCEYLIIFHDDDVMLPRLLECEVRVLDADPGVVMVHCAAALIDSEGIQYSAPPSHWPPLSEGIDFVRRYWTSMNCGVVMPSAMFRRSLALRLGGFNENLRYCLDADLWQRLAFEGGVAFLNAVLMANRLHAGQATSKILANRLQMLEERLKYAEATRVLARRHGASLDAAVGRQLSGKIATDLTELRALEASLGQTLKYAQAAVRARPVVLLHWRFLCYLVLAFLPSDLIRVLKRLRGRWFLWVRGLSHHGDAR